MQAVKATEYAEGVDNLLVTAKDVVDLPRLVSFAYVLLE